MNMYSSLADDYFVNMNLYTEMQLPSARETVLEFLGRVQKTFTSMRNFYTRESGDFVLEEDKDGGHYRFLSIEPRRICSGFVNPETVEEALSQHQLVLQLAPYMLSVSPLDCEALDFMIGFDFTYQGNHSELVADALGVGSALESLMEVPGAKVLNFEPSIMLGLEDDCRRQCRLIIETRTNAYQVRRNDFPEDQISVYFAVRQYGSLQHDASFEETILELRRDCEELLQEHVIDQVLKPLALAISTK